MQVRQGTRLCLFSFFTYPSPPLCGLVNHSVDEVKVAQRGERKEENPILFRFFILRCHLIPSFLWPFVSASFHGNNNQQAVCILLSSSCADNSKWGQNQLWVEEESRRFTSVFVREFAVKVHICFCALISLNTFCLLAVFFRACLCF